MTGPSKVLLSAGAMFLAAALAACGGGSGGGGGGGGSGSEGSAKTGTSLQTSTSSFVEGVAYDGVNFFFGVEDGQVPTNHVVGQRFDATKSLVSSPVNLGSSGDPPKVLFANGKYLLVWRSPGSPTTIKGAFVDPNGTPGSPFIIATAAANEDFMDGMSAAFDGTHYLVVYARRNDTAGNPGDAFAQMIDTSGTTFGSEIVVSNAVNQQRGASVAFDGTRYLVLFPDGSDNNCTTCFGNGIGTPTAIRGVFVTTGGATAPLSGPVFSGTSPTDLAGVALAYDGTHYLAAWEVQTGTLTRSTWSTTIEPDGTIGTQTAVGSSSAAAFGVWATVGGSGFLLTWADVRTRVNDDFVCDANEGTCADIYGQFFTAAGAANGAEFPIANGASHQFGAPAVYGAGTFMVLWTSFPDSGLGTVYADTVTPP